MRGPRQFQLAARLSRAASAVAVGLLLASVSTGGCGVAGVLRDAKAPDQHAYAGPHGRPRAYGGGVCPITSPHSHSYPPVPARAFSASKEGVVDERPRYPFWDSHAHHRQTCFRTKWHLHLEPPLPFLRYDLKRDLYTAIEDTEAVPLEVFEGRHPRRACDKVQCVFEHEHGHVPCNVKAASRAEKNHQ